MPPLHRDAYRPPEPEPRKFVNTNNDGSHFYLYSDSTILFDDGRGRNGSFMPPLTALQMFVCRDGTSFTFYPNGAGYYDNGRGNIVLIPSGAYVWLPPASPLTSDASSNASVVDSNGGRWPLVSTTHPNVVAPTRRTVAPPTIRGRRQDYTSSDDDGSSDGYDDLIKFGVHRKK